jgi:hypothetical protein
MRRLDTVVIVTAVVSMVTASFEWNQNKIAVVA